MVWAFAGDVTRVDREWPLGQSVLLERGCGRIQREGEMCSRVLLFGRQELLLRENV